MTILFFILILIVLILVHEFGHFSVAKMFGIKVHEFGIFFPPRLFAKKFGETEYSFNLLPFGGFVKIFGENYDEGKDDPRSFVNKSRWKQVSVLLAGIVFNLIFAWLALSVGYVVGLPTATEHNGFGYVQGAAPTVVATIPGSPAEKAGLLVGDRIEKLETGHDSIDIRTLNTSAQADVATNFIIAHPDESIVITYVRDDAEMIALAKAQEGIVDGRKAIGLQLEDVGTLRLPPHLALAQGAMLAWDITQNTATGLAGFLKQIVTGHANFGEVAGPIGITVFGAAAIKSGFGAAVTLAALISINLAIINLIPIPGLDGGRVFIVLVEGIRGKPISQKLMLNLTLAGFALLILLMLVVSYHDIAKLIG